ncbi:MAG: SRPBCC family protein [Kofleriaceae bacterium]
MTTAAVFIATAPEACWRAFADASQLLAWVPGLRRAQVVQVDADGLAREIQFEFSTSRTYSLVYRYDRAGLTVHWETRIGRRDGVSGHARFVAADDGTRFEYQLELGDGRSPAERLLGAPQRVADAFAAWVTTRAR